LRYGYIDPAIIKIISERRDGACPDVYRDEWLIPTSWDVKPFFDLFLIKIQINFSARRDG